MRNDGFYAGVITGAIVGALVAMAMSPGIRQPVMQGANDMGDRMRRMWRRGADAVGDALPDEMS